MLRILESADILGSLKDNLVCLNKSIVIGIGFFFLALHGSSPCIGLSGNHRECHVKGIDTCHIISIAGLTIGLGTIRVHISQLDLQAVNAILLNSLPGTGEVAVGVGGIGRRIRIVVHAEAVLVTDSGAVLIQLQQECGVQHRGKLAALLKLPIELIALGLRGSAGAGSGVFALSTATSRQYGGQHQNRENKCQDLTHFHFVFLQLSYYVP